MGPIKEKASIGTFLDNNSSIFINKDGKLKFDISSNRYKIIKYLADKFDLKVYRIGQNYRITTAKTNFSKIYEEYKEYFYINKDKYALGYEYANGEKFENNKDGRSSQHKEKYYNLLKSTPKNKLTGGESELYKINYFDRLEWWNLMESNNFYAPFFIINTQDENKIKFASLFLNKSISKSGTLFLIRLNKQEAINFAEFLMEYSFDNKLYHLLFEYKDNYRKEFAGKFKLTKNEQVLDENLTSKTVNEKIEGRLQKRREKAEEKQKALDSIKSEKLKIKEQKRAERKEKFKIQKEATELRKREERERRKEKKLLKELEIINQINSGYKTCKTCGLTKEINYFGVCKTNIGGYKYNCKKCDYKKYVLSDMEKMRKRAREWQKANPEKVREMAKRERKKPQQRIKNTIKFRIKSYLTDRCTGNFKEIIGCTPKELKSYIESLWSPSMSWENYGKEWEIDHIIPCAAFDMTDPIQLHQCWNYKNLRPLDKNENWSKSDILPTGDSARVLKSENPELLTEIVRGELEKLEIDIPTPIPT